MQAGTKIVDEDCGKTIRVSEIIEPNAEAVEVLNRGYEAYRMFYAALRPAMKIIGEK